MQECGVQFGELPVSGYFWRAISGMESPIDYVAGLSLTFEQANLDFARHFARGFAAAGDGETARLLERIYQDEIAHVAYGLKWFRRWKNPSENDWDAFCRQLKFPLSPSRARGIILNVESRQAAGFDSRFIAELEVHSQSKGRTPNVFVFNPFPEASIAQGRSFTPTKQQTLLANDLANLPQFLCREGDIVLLPHRPSVEFLSAIKQAGFALPEFVELRAGRIHSTHSLAHRKIGALRPWAWGPDSLEILRPLLGNVTAENRPADHRFSPAIARLYSKAWSAVFLRKMLARQPDSSLLCTTDEVGLAVDSLEAALAAIEEIRRRGHHKIIAKEALGLAGHNSIRLWEPSVLETQRRWMARALEHGQIVIEPWLERLTDFSIQLEMNSRGLKVCGYTGLINDLRGQFQANWAAANHARRIPLSVISLFRSLPAAVERIERLHRDILASLEEDLDRAGYLGPLGIDAFVYRSFSGETRLKPIVEINPRYTMGRLTVELMRQVCPGSRGVFRIVSRVLAQKEGFKSLSTYAHNMNERFPIRLEGTPAPRIREGMICLNDPNRAQTCLAIFQVSRADNIF